MSGSLLAPASPPFAPTHAGAVQKTVALPFEQGPLVAPSAGATLELPKGYMLVADDWRAGSPALRQVRRAPVGAKDGARGPQPKQRRRRRRRVRDDGASAAGIVHRDVLIWVELRRRGRPGRAALSAGAGRVRDGAGTRALARRRRIVRGLVGRAERGDRPRGARRTSGSRRTAGSPGSPSMRIRRNRWSAPTGCTSAPPCTRPSTGSETSPCRCRISPCAPAREGWRRRGRPTR